MREASSLIFADDIGTGESSLESSFGVGLVLIGAEGFNVPYFPTAVACGILMPFLWTGLSFWLT